MPSMLFANRKGEIKDFPALNMAGRSGYDFQQPELEDLIPLPPGSDLFVLPDRVPVGIDPASGEPYQLDTSPDDPEEGIQAVAAFMAPAHTAIHWAAFEKTGNDACRLPLFAYTAVGWLDGRFWVSGFRSDPGRRQEINRYRPEQVRKQTNLLLRQQRDNRLVQHLGKCSLTYGCPAAINFFMGRWEAPLPSSTSCNARCVGCISLQPSGCCPATQERISFTPTPGEIAGVAIPHLEKVKRGVVSFGQGCEGEPLLSATVIDEAIRQIRRKTDQGTINLNSNASLPEAVDRLAAAGLDSMRVSMNSAREQFHQRYYRPSGFSLDEVKESIAVMKNRHRFVSLNYFILPGFTDDPDEFSALCSLLEHCKPDLIQLRNLNMDPDWYLEAVQFARNREPLGIRTWLRTLKDRFPKLRFGYFNPPLR